MKTKITLSPITKLDNNSSGGSANNSVRSITNTTSSTVLKEVPISVTDIDAEDVIFYAKLLGIDPFLEPQLLWIAQAGLVSPLPVGWIACEDHKNRLYYHNLTTGTSSWDHPNDHHYRSLVIKYRTERVKKDKKKSKKQLKKQSKSVNHKTTTKKVNSKVKGQKTNKKSRVSTQKSLTLSTSSTAAGGGVTSVTYTTMSGISSIGNLHFFEDDEDDFKDLIRPRKALGNNSTPTPTGLNGLTTPDNRKQENKTESLLDLLRPKSSESTKSQPSVTLSTPLPTPKPAPKEQDSIESVEFDLANEIEEDAESEGSSIASLEKYHVDRKKDYQISESELTPQLPKETTKKVESKTINNKIEDNKSNSKQQDPKPFSNIIPPSFLKEDSDPESDHWNSLPDNEQLTAQEDPFENLFNNPKSNKHDPNRPMSAKVRPMNAQESSQQQQQHVTSYSRRNLQKKLSILEEEDDAIEEDDEIEEIFEVDEDDEEVESVNESVAEVKEVSKMNGFDNTNTKITPESPKVSLPEAAAAAAQQSSSSKQENKQTSQMGRISENILALNSTALTVVQEPLKKSLPDSVLPKINDTHTSSRLPNVETVNRNSSQISSKIQEFTNEKEEESDFESESQASKELENQKASKTSLETQFQQLTASFTDQITSLRAEITSESAKSHLDLTREFQETFQKFDQKISEEKNDIKKITDKVDNLESKLKEVQEQKAKPRNDDSENLKFEQRLTQLETQLTRSTSSQLERLEQKLSSAQVENSRKVLSQLSETALRVSSEQCTGLRGELTGALKDVQRLCRENATALHELRNRTTSQQNQVNHELNDAAQVNESRLDARIQVLHGSLLDQMDRRIEQKFTQELNKRNDAREEEESRANKMDQINEIRIQRQIEQQREQLNARLDQLQAKIDQVLEQIEDKMKKDDTNQDKVSRKPHLPNQNTTSTEPELQNDDSDSPHMDTMVQNAIFQGAKSQLKITSTEIAPNSNPTKNNNNKVSNEPSVNDAPMNSPNCAAAAANSNPIINTTVRQCKALQRTLQYCARQLQDTLKQLNINGQVVDNSDASNISQPIVGNQRYERRNNNKESHNRSNYYQQRKSRRNSYNNNTRIINKARSHENIASSLSSEREQDNELDERKRGDNSSVTPNSSIPDMVAPSGVYDSDVRMNFVKHRQLSQSSPNLLQEGQQQSNFHHHNLKSSTLPKYPHDYHDQYYSRTINDPTFRRLNHLYDEPVRIHYNAIHQHRRRDTKDRKIRDIRASSSSLIALIRQTSGQLKQELSSLENIGAERLKSSFFGPSELIIMNRGVSKSAGNQEEGGNQPRIYFEDSNKYSDENLIRQLQSIRSTVNERLKKMAIVIEQQKTTQI